MTIIDKIKAMGYGIREYVPGEYVPGCTHKPNGFLEVRFKRNEVDWTIIPQTNDQGIYFCGDNHVSSAKEAELLVEQGVAYKATTNELYAAYFHQGEEEQCKFRYGYGMKSRAYLESAMEEIGLLTIEKDIKGTSMLSTAAERIFVHTFMHIEKIDECWIVETDDKFDDGSFDFVFDCVGCVRMCFARRPTDQDLESAFAIMKIESRLQHSKETFRCWECARTVHWTDVEGNIVEKAARFKKKYCGC